MQKCLKSDTIIKVPGLRRWMYRYGSVRQRAVPVGLVDVGCEVSEGRVSFS